MTPQGPVPEAPTTLTITIPAPTGETRQKAIEEANNISQKALHAIREARGEKQKKLRAMQVAKAVNPDDLQRAHKQMEDLVQKSNSEVKMIVDNAKKVLEGGV